MRLEIPIACFLSVPLLLWPVSIHIRARNVAIVTLIIVLLLVNVIRGINAVRSAHPIRWKAPTDFIDHLAGQRHSEAYNLVRYQ